eukprot:TRINITY_DN7239_c0_g1_i2.p1 TRINITY_DN7239_c0_g1~~TRINITY_DN7239_c0_g1_i2.p1  ORF type:complete len:231 (-),score=55.89 TRINITY_DN7239_c0_g1_i2:133-825(-)
MALSLPSCSRGFLLAAIFAACCGRCAVGSSETEEDSSIVKLTQFNFDDNVRNGNWFVKFFAPWCTHCQRMRPMWEKLAQRAIEQDWPVKIAEVDCTRSKEVCDKAQVKAFPMLALISNGALKGKYKGETSLQQFEDWLKNQNVLEAESVLFGGGGGGASVKAKPGTVTATHTAAVMAVLYNLLESFPTQNKIINVYFYGGTLLIFLVGVLVLISSMLGNEDGEDDHEKTN